MLPPVSSLTNDIKGLPPTLSSLEGATNFINVVAAFMDQLQAGPLGAPGIFTYTKPPAIALLMALPPVKDNSWITNFANAIHAGSTAAILVPGTVTAPVWTASIVDVLPPVNTTIAAALPVLIGGLNNVSYSNNPPQPLAQAISDYTKAFTFLVTGLALAPPAPPIPIPLTFPAQ